LVVHFTGKLDRLEQHFLAFAEEGVLQKVSLKLLGVLFTQLRTSGVPNKHDNILHFVGLLASTRRVRWADLVYFAWPPRVTPDFAPDNLVNFVLRYLFLFRAARR